MATHHPAGTDPGHLPPGQHPGRSQGHGSLADRLDTAIVKLDAVRDRPAVSLGLALGLIAVLVAGWWLGRPGSASAVEDAIPLATASTALTSAPAPAVAADAAAAADPAEPEVLIVHVAGAVAEPGIVELEPGSRVVDAIAAAGGPAGDADVHQLNLAAPVSDGLQIRVPVEGEVVQPPVGVTVAAADGSGGLININQAPALELEALPGIGPALAAAIVEYRTEHGPFTTVAGLESVPGIGPAKLAALVEQVTL